MKFHIVNKTLWEKLQASLATATRKTQQNIKINFLNLKFSLYETLCYRYNSLAYINPQTLTDWDTRTGSQQVKYVHQFGISVSYSICTGTEYSKSVLKLNLFSSSEKTSNIRVTVFMVRLQLWFVVKKKVDFVIWFFPNPLLCFHAPWASNSIKFIVLHTLISVCSLNTEYWIGCAINLRKVFSKFRYIQGSGGLLN